MDFFCWHNLFLLLFSFEFLISVFMYLFQIQFCNLLCNNIFTGYLIGPKTSSKLLYLDQGYKKCTSHGCTFPQGEIWEHNWISGEKQNNYSLTPPRVDQPQKCIDDRIGLMCLLFLSTASSNLLLFQIETYFPWTLVTVLLITNG